MESVRAVGRVGRPMTAVRPGDLLVAHVVLSDGVFDGSVVLILDADDSGTLGVVLNRLSEVDVDAVLPGWREHLTPPQVLFDGGPVSPNGAICLAQLAGSEEPPGWRRVFDDIGLLHLDTPVELVAGAYRSLRIFAGYAGWQAGQLEAELVRHAWFVVPSENGDVFGLDQEDLWRRVLRRQPLATAVWSTFTDEPEAN